MEDAIALARAHKRLREERRQIQIGLDEALARDEQSDEEERVVRFAADLPEGTVVFALSSTCLPARILGTGLPTTPVRSIRASSSAVKTRE
jgi:hypothetical protein